MVLENGGVNKFAQQSADALYQLKNCYEKLIEKLSHGLQNIRKEEESSTILAKYLQYQEQIEELKRKNRDMAAELYLLQLSQREELQKARVLEQFLRQQTTEHASSEAFLTQDSAEPRSYLIEYDEQGRMSLRPFSAAGAPEVAATGRSRLAQLLEELQQARDQSLVELYSREGLTAELEDVLDHLAKQNASLYRDYGQSPADLQECFLVIHQRE